MPGPETPARTMEEYKRQAIALGILNPDGSLKKDNDQQEQPSVPNDSEPSSEIEH